MLFKDLFNDYDEKKSKYNPFPQYKDSNPAYSEKIADVQNDAYSEKNANKGMAIKIDIKNNIRSFSHKTARLYHACGKDGFMQTIHINHRARLSYPQSKLYSRDIKSSADGILTVYQETANERLKAYNKFVFLSKPIDSLAARRVTEKSGAAKYAAVKSRKLMKKAETLRADKLSGVYLFDSIATSQREELENQYKFAHSGAASSNNDNINTQNGNANNQTGNNYKENDFNFNSQTGADFNNQNPDAKEKTAKAGIFSVFADIGNKISMFGNKIGTQITKGVHDGINSGYEYVAEKGNAETKYNFALRLEAENKPENNAKIINLLTKAATDGNELAAYNLGSRYNFGHGVAADKIKAAQMYRLAAEKGNAGAIASLITLLENGEVKTNNAGELIYWLENAASGGNYEAANNLGCRYDIGDGVTVDKKQAEKWLSFAAEHGLDKAQYNYALFLLNLKGEKGKKQAKIWCGKAAEQGYILASKLYLQL